MLGLLDRPLIETVGKFPIGKVIKKYFRSTTSLSSPEEKQSKPSLFISMGITMTESRSIRLASATFVN